MEEFQKKIEVKFKLLAYATKDLDQLQTRGNERELVRKKKVLEDALDAIQELKYACVEGQLEGEVEDDIIENWTAEVDKRSSVFETFLERVNRSMETIKEESHATTLEKDRIIEAERSKQKFIEEEKLEQMRLEMRKTYEEKTEATKASPGKTNAKLPKLQITKFKGTHIDWFRFWGQFSSEIDSAEISPVTKFSYLKEMLPSQATSLVGGLPFNAEGYERAKAILTTRYGKTSEIVNAHIQCIMNLPIIASSNNNKIDDFYQTLVVHIQSLETLGKLNDINGYVRMTLDKLSGIRADLVRLDDEWQDWKFPQLVEALRNWTVRNPKSAEQKEVQNSASKRPERSFLAKDQQSIQSNCVYCGGSHRSSSCRKFGSVTERRRILAEERLCFNCTKGGHQAKECKGRSCFNCNSRHHTSICNKEASQRKEQMMCVPSDKAVMYPIVVVSINGFKFRALLDTGAGSSYISSKLVKVIGLKADRKESRRIEMLMHATSTIAHLYKVDVSNLKGDVTIKTEVTRVDKEVLLTVPNPHYETIIGRYKHLHGVTMEDWDTKSELPIHMILGTDVYCKIKMEEKPRIGQPEQPVAELTKFGWVLMSPGTDMDNQIYLTMNSSPHDYDRLCRLDVLGLEDVPDGDQWVVYSDFKEQLKRHPEGWYETGLLWKANHGVLPNNKAASIGRMNNLITKLKRDPQLLKEYDRIISDQLNEGIVEVAPELATGLEYYLPHKAVVRESAESTKLRIVYDASAKPDTKSLSLNDCLETGPPLQNLLWSVLIRNRMRPITLTGDISKAFLQIRIREEHRDVLRFHWFKDLKTFQPIVLRFTRAVFGLVQSPFLLNGTLQHHLEHYPCYPKVIDLIKDDIYVDDIISGGNTVSEVEKVKDATVEIFKDAQFQLHKWHSNVPKLAGDSNEETNESAILGVFWDTNDDKLAVIFPLTKIEATKRSVLKYLASIYDPLGFTSPIHLKGKFVYRDICNNKLGWDQQLPPDLYTTWKRWLQRLPNKIEVPRAIPRYRMEVEFIDLHAFADASKEGTSAVVYAVVTQSSGVSKGLVCSKSRLAKKSLTIPRLELVAAHMASNLIHNTSDALSRFPIRKLVAWSDSTVALHWIKGNGNYKEFVRNRVTKINAKNDVSWRHIGTEENPADIGSRGCHGDTLRANWFSGPSWLSDENNWPDDITTTPSTESEHEAKQIKVIMATTRSKEDAIGTVIVKFNLWKTLRVTSWILRFVNNCKSKSKQKRVNGPLSTDEIEASNLTWIKKTQSNHENTDKFKIDNRRLNLQKNIRGVYICLGRIEGSYPIYLPADDVFTQKLVQHSHKRTLHGGVGFTMADIRRKFWIPRLRQLIKSVIHKCHGCKRFHAIAFVRPIAGNLPSSRTMGSRPFQVVGLDFAGPFIYLTENKVEKKCYILLYACSLTRAVYLDVLKDQTFEGVITSFKAFIARRTRPSVIYSDNFSSFGTASRWTKRVASQEKLHDFLASQEMAWRFNLSRAPWWGGQFERLVGLMKKTLFKSLGKSKPRFEEFKALLLDIEVTINNRPLGYIEDDIQSEVLTPNLMMFDYPVEIPHLDNINEDLNATVSLKNRYRYLKSARQRIWARWSNEYVKYLRERHDLTHRGNGKQPREGDVLLIKGDERNRAHWKIGIVKEVFPGKDGHIRAVRLRAGQDFLERAPEHLYPLELSCDEASDVTNDSNQLDVATRGIRAQNAEASDVTNVSNQLDVATREIRSQNTKASDVTNDSSQLDISARKFRPRRNAKEIARLVISDQLENEIRAPVVE